ncbi:hypothetical protein KIPB_005693 [Kipferlia bialata]|uniref:Uncharacterized protein n=1 Tax=Kipferlia bialata TaxID=797122 RepID=A0A9K3GJ44_9EUKA|nr:hypothetical protein KIPB_005693 [Kipferlia bialata]|eukprot:g5693.t1
MRAFPRNVHPDDREKVEQAIKDCATGVSPTYIMVQRRMMFPTKEYHMFRVTASAVRWGQDGLPTLLGGVSERVSDNLIPGTKTGRLEGKHDAVTDTTTTEVTMPLPPYRRHKSPLMTLDTATRPDDDPADVLDGVGIGRRKAWLGYLLPHRGTLPGYKQISLPPDMATPGSLRSLFDSALTDTAFNAETFDAITGGFGFGWLILHAFYQNITRCPSMSPKMVIALTLSLTAPSGPTFKMETPLLPHSLSRLAGHPSTFPSLGVVSGSCVSTPGCGSSMALRYHRGTGLKTVLSRHMSPFYTPIASGTVTPYTKTEYQDQSVTAMHRSYCRHPVLDPSSPVYAASQAHPPLMCLLSVLAAACRITDHPGISESHVQEKERFG